MTHGFEAHAAVATPEPLEHPLESVRSASRHPGNVAVSVRGLSKAFPRRRQWSEILRRPFRRSEGVIAVDRVSFDVFEGELVGLLGVNGAGKTTLLKMLCTLIEPDAGTVTMSGVDLRTEADVIRGLVAPVIADERSLNWRLSARENLRFYGTLSGLRGPELAERIEGVLGITGLQDCDSKLVGAFSSGMKQRLLLARGLLAQPKILLLDEPTRSLDPLAARDFRSMLRNRIAGSEVQAVVLATHNPEEARLCDRVVVLSEGRLVAGGRPEQLARRVGHSVYRLRTRQPVAPRLRHVLGLQSVARSDVRDGWAVLEVELPGDRAAADLLRSLVLEGIEVAGLEKREPTLAELVEALVKEDSRLDG